MSLPSINFAIRRVSSKEYAEILCRCLPYMSTPEELRPLLEEDDYKSMAYIYGTMPPPPHLSKVIKDIRQILLTPCDS